MMTSNKPRLVIFASGRGSNAREIVRYGEKTGEYEVMAIVSNRKNAGVLEWADKQGIHTIIINRSAFYDSEELVDHLISLGVDLIVLAGFLWLVPPYFVKAFENRIVNIHPALLPKYGGKGMFGLHVHKAVVDNKEKQSGITIHWVNEKYDEGRPVFQTKCFINRENPEELAAKVLRLEHFFYPRVVAGLARSIKKACGT